MRCDAFPEGIPMNILLNQVDHRKEVEGDHGIRFQPRKGMESPFGKEKDDAG